MKKGDLDTFVQVALSRGLPGAAQALVLSLQCDAGPARPDSGVLHHPKLDGATAHRSQPSHQSVPKHHQHLQGHLQLPEPLEAKVMSKNKWHDTQN